MASLLPVEIKFAQNLAANEKKIRFRAVKKLKKYLRAKSSSKKGKSMLSSSGTNIEKLFTPEFATSHPSNIIYTVMTCYMPVVLLSQHMSSKFCTTST